MLFFVERMNYYDISRNLVFWHKRFSFNKASPVALLRNIHIADIYV